VPALLAVGLEGFWGLTISAIALPILAAVRSSDGLPLDDARQAWQVGPLFSIAVAALFARLARDRRKPAQTVCRPNVWH
jgi:hypothetical protein